MTEEKRKKSVSSLRSLWRPAVLLIAVIILIVLARLFNLGEKLGELRIWIDSLGIFGPLIFIILYAVAVIAALPGSALTIAAGALFGSVIGIIVVSIASTLGASLAFLVSRYFARESVANWLKDNPRFKKLDDMTEKRGAIIVALTRLVPLFPFNLLNYGFGLTRVKFVTYVFWSWLCMLPGTVLYVVGADAVTEALKDGKIPWLLVGILAVIIILLTVLVRSARKKLKADEEIIVNEPREGI